MRTLIAGFGNTLRGDDGFGIEVIRRLEEEGCRGEVELLEVGTGGIRLAQELLTPRDRLIVVDALRRGGPPGTVYVLAVDGVREAEEIDLHLTPPAQALALARALGALPAQVFIVGCEPSMLDELTMELSPPVRGAVETAMRRIRELLGGRPAGGDGAA